MRTREKQSGAQLAKLVESSQERSWVGSLVAMRSMGGGGGGARGSLGYHLLQREANGQFAGMYAFFLSNALNCFVVYLRFMARRREEWAALHWVGLAAAVLAVVAYVCSARMDPGFVSLDGGLEDRRAVREMQRSAADVERVCSTCGVRKPLRSKHCRFTRRCVARFDHYCPWIGNAVGYRNHPPFLTFLGCSTLAGAIFTAFAHRLVFLDPTCPGVALLDVPSIFFYYWFFLRNYTHMALTAGLVTLFTLYFAIMFFSHLRMVLLNITTNEMENAWRLPYFMSHQADHTSFRNPFHRGCCVNAIDGFLRPLMQAASGRGALRGADGATRACPSRVYHDYFRTFRMDDLEDVRAPSVAELLCPCAELAAAPRADGRGYEMLPLHEEEPGGGPSPV